MILIRKTVLKSITLRAYRSQGWGGGFHGKLRPQNVNLSDMDPNMPERLFTTLMLVRGNNNIIAYNTTGFTKKSVRRTGNYFIRKTVLKSVTLRAYRPKAGKAVFMENLYICMVAGKGTVF